jgi:hypothetical protein
MSDMATYGHVVLFLIGTMPTFVHSSPSLWFVFPSLFVEIGVAALHDVWHNRHPMDLLAFVASTAELEESVHDSRFTTNNSL